MRARQKVKARDYNLWSPSYEFKEHHYASHPLYSPQQLQFCSHFTHLSCKIFIFDDCSNLSKCPALILLQFDSLGSVLTLVITYSHTRKSMAFGWTTTGSNCGKVIVSSISSAWNKLNDFSTPAFVRTCSWKFWSHLLLGWCWHLMRAYYSVGCAEYNSKRCIWDASIKVTHYAIQFFQLSFVRWTTMFLVNVVVMRSHIRDVLFWNRLPAAILSVFKFKVNCFPQLLQPILTFSCFDDFWLGFLFIIPVA